MNNYRAQELKMLQALPFEVKLKKSMLRIKEWYEYYAGNVYIAYSGGKDSQVLTHLVKSIYPDVIVVGVNTGLEYSSVQRKMKELSNVILYPEMNFVQVITKYGYPIISKEVSQCLAGARKYLYHNVINEEREYTKYKYWYDRFVKERSISHEETIGSHP